VADGPLAACSYNSREPQIHVISMASTTEKSDLVRILHTYE